MSSTKCFNDLSCKIALSNKLLTETPHLGLTIRFFFSQHAHYIQKLYKMCAHTHILSISINVIVTVCRRKV